METHRSKSKKLAELSQTQDSKKSSGSKTLKVKSSKTTRVQKSKPTTSSDKKKQKEKLQQRAKADKESVKAKAQNKEATCSSTTKSMSKGSPSAPKSTSASSSTKKEKTEFTKEKTASTKEKQQNMQAAIKIGGAPRLHKGTASEVVSYYGDDDDEDERSKSRKRTASEIGDIDDDEDGEDNNDEDEDEGEAEGQLGNHPLTKIRRIQNDKSEEADAQHSHKNKESVHNPAIWKIVSGGAVASSDWTVTTTTTVVTSKDAKVATSTVDVGAATFTTKMEAASVATGGIGHVVVEDVQGAVSHLSIDGQGDSENKPRDLTEMADVCGDLGSAVDTPIPRRETLSVLNDDTLEKHWTSARGKLD
ncbi:hypothetical protein BGZ96_009705 [Linnemannia gamsii]|uniref:Uncharacterized protein n=1 Tax=Linnemannia gamsii TaxID=64522 RepID=A0ABQ7KJ51_9FUNG|nr:hypothetical protein BGZ96_009705 [Linnemannia gamsii]